MGQGKKKRTKSASSGLSKMRNASRRAQRLTLKKKRWERYIREIGTGKRKGDVMRWDTSKIEKHIEFLKKVG